MFDAAQAQARTRKSGVESLICLFPNLSDSVNAHSSTPPESVAACEHRYARDILGNLELHVPASLGKRPMLVFPALCQAWFIATSQYPHPCKERIGGRKSKGIWMVTLKNTFVEIRDLTFAHH